MRRLIQSSASAAWRETKWPVRAHTSQAAARTADKQIREPLQLDFVPPRGSGAEKEAATALLNFIQRCGGEGIVTITGAGLSTESGIPDYRSPKGSFSVGHKPVQHGDFVRCAENRKRYWARSMAGWRPFMEAQPNAGHHAIAALERRGVVSAVVTQNVDALHQKAGSAHVVDLHGRNDEVTCLACATTMPRHAFHTNLLEPLNPAWAPSSSAAASASTLRLRPDGDAALETSDFSSFRVPGCPECKEGILKPRVVFFGEAVGSEMRGEVASLVAGAAGLLVVGSSLWTPLPFRLVEGAVRRGTPVAILNVGPTRACTRQLAPLLKIEEQCGPVLSRVAAALAPDHMQRSGGGGVLTQSLR